MSDTEEGEIASSASIPSAAVAAVASRPSIARTQSVIGDPPKRHIDKFLPRYLWTTPTPSLLHDAVTLTIDSMIIALNQMLRRANSNIRWYPDKEELKAKIAKSDDYVIRSTDYYYTQLKQIRGFLFDWIYQGDHEETVLVIDFANLYLAVTKWFEKNFGNYRSSDFTEKMHELLNEIIKTKGCRRIIISVQNHNIDREEFYNLLDLLQKYNFYPQDILVITAHNRASSDDLHYVLCMEILRDLGIQYYLLTGDYLRDYVLLKNEEKKAILTIPDIASQIIDPYIIWGLRSEYDRNTALQKLGLPPPPRGGTKKNKKSLLNKYSRKIKHFKKVKTLHKKVKSLHKKHKTTIKAHRKYNITYKKK